MSDPLNEALIAAINEAAGQFGPKLRDRLVKPSQCGQTKRRGYIMKGVLAPGDAAAMVAHPGAGKSVAAPYIGYGIAQGRRVFGLRTNAGKVFYAAAEDIAGTPARGRALPAIR
jgi:RecA-family ATPase